MSDIERYLDELSERLAGTGTAGMRVLIEAEAHLYAAAADAMARGLPEEQAEHEAVSRFGSSGLVARKLRSAHGGRVNRIMSATWLLAGWTACGLGVYSTLPYLVWSMEHGWGTQPCTVVLSPDCYLAGRVPVTPVSTAATVAAAGVVLLLCRWLAVRYAKLTAIRRTFAR